MVYNRVKRPRPPIGLGEEPLQVLHNVHIGNDGEMLDVGVYIAHCVHLSIGLIANKRQKSVQRAALASSE